MSRKRRKTGVEALEAAYAMADHDVLRNHLGVNIGDDLLKLALSHRSFANENGHLPNNERLEFLGDAVLGLAVAEELYRRYPERTESGISTMRAGVVNMYALADVARGIDLGEHVLLGRGEQKTGGKDKHSILADTMEALLGAIYLQEGWDTAKQTVLKLFAQRIKIAPAVARTMDWKTSLAERCSARKLDAPVYSYESEGPEHDCIFTAVVTINGVARGSGRGHTKKEAEMQAANQAFDALAL
ncbi:ribonuclease III [Corynebacterium ulceribovis]|uniref:ribonuclease III n=1 Tax=Corynebacterium ulceribovis TaxID=487732 RepID=UPI00035D2284|nr:ribonuclease III [Corynebacterium ulceribovis]